MISLRRAVVAIGLGLALVLNLSGAAMAATVGTAPASWTPFLRSSPADQVVEELEPCNGTMYAVGTISSVGRGTATYARANAFSFSQTTGVMTSWAPQVNAPVRSIAFTPDCSVAYLGGSFTKVNGVAAAHLVAVSTSTGAIRTGFAHTVNGAVNTVRYTHGLVVIGGRFTQVNGVNRSAMASLSPSTGAVTAYLNLAFSGTYPDTGPTMVYNSQLSHAGTKLLIEGVFTSIAGRARQQVAVLDLGTTSASVNAWTSSELSQPCDRAWYGRSAAWSPNDSTIYIATTGANPPTGTGTGLCDAVSAFPASATSVQHTWVNYTGCDTYYSVVADADNVYVSGHERWANNPHGCDRAGPGAVSRPGIASMNPTTGLATPWNPTRSLGHGSHQLLLTPAGLWVASDTYTDGQAQMCGGKWNHGGICFLPY